MNILFNKDGLKTPLRPKVNMVKESIIQSALATYLNAPNHGFDDAEKELLPITLIKHWDYYIEEYFLADLFEQDGWNIDPGFVSRLENICALINDSFDDEVVRWGTDNDINPPYKIGDLLDIGCITGISTEKAACFEVLIDGMPEKYERRKLVKFEDAKPVS